MPWFDFTSDFNWSPPEKKGLVTIAYKAGQSLNVREICAREAERRGRGSRRKPVADEPVEAEAAVDGGG